MNLLKKILKVIARIIHFTPATEEQKLEYAKRNSSTCYDYNKSNETVINPASGLPMMGCVDVSGNSFGSNSSSDDYYRRSQEDYYRSLSNNNYNSSQYDYWKN
jgi:hypothetical protein